MRTLRSLGAPAALLVLLVLLVLAGPVHAHVGVQPGSAPAGSDVELTFLVPNERRTTATVELRIQLPVSFERVGPGAVTGWEHTVDGDVVTWSGGRIEPGERGEFPLLVGPLPAGDPLVFRAVQTYDDGEVVRWIEDGPGADHPAPVLVVAGEGAAGVTTTTTHHAGLDAPADQEGAESADGVDGAGADPQPTVVPTAPVDGDGDGGIPTGVLVLGAVVLAALLVALVLVLNRRDPSRTP